MVDSIIIDGNYLYISGWFPYFNTNINELYIFLEHIIFLKFNKLYDNNIENKLVTYTEYINLIEETIVSNNIKHILVVDNISYDGYYIDLETFDSLKEFSSNIAHCIFGVENTNI